VLPPEEDQERQVNEHDTGGSAGPSGPRVGEQARARGVGNVYLQSSTLALAKQAPVHARSVNPRARVRLSLLVFQRVSG
jgi:hypothetical protein